MKAFDMTYVPNNTRNVTCEKSHWPEPTSGLFCTLGNFFKELGLRVCFSK